MASKSSSKKVPERRIRQGQAIAELERRNPNAYTKTKNCLDKIPDEELKRKDRIDTFRKQVAEARQLAHIDILREEALTGIDHATIEAIECDCNRKKIDRDYLLIFSLVFQNSPLFFIRGNDYDGVYDENAGIEPMNIWEDSVLIPAQWIVKKLTDCSKDDEEEKKINRRLLEIFALLCTASENKKRAVFQAIHSAPCFLPYFTSLDPQSPSKGENKKSIPLENYKISKEEWLSFTISPQYQGLKIQPLQNLKIHGIKSGTVGSGAGSIKELSAMNMFDALTDLGSKDPKMLDLMLLIADSDLEMRKTICNWLEMGGFLRDKRSFG